MLRINCYILHFNSALPKIIKTGFSAINLIYFFTAGPDEVIYPHTYFHSDKSCLNFMNLLWDLCVNLIELFTFSFSVVDC